MKFKLGFLGLIITIISCSSPEEREITASDNPNEGNNPSNNWSIPITDIYDGTGKDGIPVIENPVFVNAKDLKNNSYLNDSDLVIGLVFENETRAYPHRILDWHEIVNDEINGEKFTVNYCPLTGTAFTWKGNFNGINKTFGISGLLYKTNLILYDRETDSNWSQLKLECVNGKLRGEKPTLIQTIETDWATWQKLYPNTKVLSNEQGLNRNYKEYPYGGYKEIHDFFISPVQPINNALPLKERVFAILKNNNSKVYKFQDFLNGNAIKDTFEKDNLLIIGNQHFLKAFKIEGDLNNLNFNFRSINSDAFFSDNEGNQWNIQGKAIEGPRKGEQLKNTNSLVSFWFAIGAFYPKVKIY